MMKPREDMSDWKTSGFKEYKWIVADPAVLGGKLAVRGTRFSVSFILSCLAEGMSVEEIQQTYAPFPVEAIPEIMKVASEALDTPNVASSRAALQPSLSFRGAKGRGICFGDLKEKQIPRYAWDDRPVG